MKDVEVDHHEVARSALGILADKGVALERGARVLDLGCGDGRGVAAYLDAGVDAFGADVRLERETKRLRRIEHPYRLPFADGSFAAVLSHQVLEHVHDHDAVAAEIARVCREQGVTLHLFPPRWRIIEPHTFVPLGGVVRTQWWLSIWAALGVRNSFQRGWSARRVVTANAEYLATRTNYVAANDLCKIFARHFREAALVETELLTHARGRSRALAPLAERFPAVARAYGALRLRALFARAPRSRKEPT